MKRIACLLCALASAGAANAQSFSGLGTPKEELPVVQPVLLAESRAAQDGADQMFSRTLDEMTGPCANVVISRFNSLYGGGVTVPGEKEPKPVSAEIVAEVVKRIRERVRSGDITLSVSSFVEGSAAWSAVVYQGKVGGTIEIKESDIKRAIGEDRRPRRARLLQRQEWLADALIHETSHAFYSIFKHEFKAKPTWKPERLTNRFVRVRFWDGSKPCDHPDEYENCRTVLNEVQFTGNSYSESIWPNEETARMVAQGMYVCTKGAAVGRILNLQK